MSEKEQSIELLESREKTPANYDIKDADVKLSQQDQEYDVEKISVEPENVHGDAYSDDTETSGEISPTCRVIITVQDRCTKFFTTHKKIIKTVLLCMLLVCYVAYFIAACYLDFHRALPLVIINSLVIAWALYTWLTTLLSSRASNLWRTFKARTESKMSLIKWLCGVAIAMTVLVIITAIIGVEFRQYRGAAGLFFFVTLLFLTSHNPAAVNWRPVLWGMLLNFIFALVVLKSSAGLIAFKWLAKQVTTFLGYTDVGSAFVFGKDTFMDHFFAFKILPTIVLFSCIISLLYYLGVMQVVISRIAGMLQFTMNTSATESLSCAGNIFVGQTEAPILIRPFLPQMTKSELLAVMTGGFATVSGGVLAAYIGFGIDAVHLICASVMNAPMALAVSKLTYPETEKPNYLKGKKIQFEKPTQKNVIEAVADGASQSIGLVANIAVNLIAFLSLLAFVNAIFSWIGSLVDYPHLSFELMCSYVFWIIPLMMGVDPEDCQLVAELIGTKVILNEFVAYEKLGKFIENRQACTKPYINRRSEVIATYALCGFSNLSSIGVQLGGIGAMAPSRSAHLATLVMRALFAGVVATLMTASLAGMLVTISAYDDNDPCQGNATAFNNTTPAAGLNSTSYL